MTRGIQQSRDMWKKFMETQWFPFIRYPLLKDPKTGEFLKNPDGSYQKGEPELTRVQGSLRPIELWEYVFPAEGFKIENGKAVPTTNMHNLKAAIAMQNLQKAYNNLRPEVNNYAWILRKMMKLKKIPELDISNKEQWEITDHLVPMAGMASYPVGIKEDFIGDTPNYGYWQENI